MRHEAVAHIFRSLGVEHSKPSGEGWEMFSCPLAPTRHDKGLDRRPSLGVKIGPGESGFICHSCGVSGGSLFWLVRACRTDGIIDEETARRIYQEIKWTESHEPQEEDQAIEIMPSLDPEWIDRLSTMHKYYTERKFSKAEVMHWRLGAHKNVLLFPCVLPDDSVPFIQARLASEKKFWYLPEGIRRTYVLGSHLLTGTERATIVSEGIFSAMRIRRALKKLDLLGEIGVVCTLGSKANPRQIDHLLSLTRDELIIATDGDYAGDLAADKLEEIGRQRCKIVSRVMLPAGMDPDDVGTDKLTTLITARENLLMQRMRQLLQVHNNGQGQNRHQRSR